MKLQKFKEKDTKKVTIIVTVICCILLIAGVIFYNSFALYEQKKQFNVINGNIMSSGDLNFIYYIDESTTFTVPQKNEGYRYNSKSYCSNGVTVKWDHSKWKAILDFSNYKAEGEKTKCHIYFDTQSTGPAVTYILNLSETSNELIHDNTNEDNVRYIGANPNNYVSFNNELWRIVGVFQDVEDENGTKGARLKLVKKDDIGAYSWNDKESNNWASSSIMKLLNPGYANESKNNSLYWSKEKGTCSSGAYDTSSCDFTEIGLYDNTKSFIDQVVWPLGGSKKIESTASEFYENEHGDMVYNENSKNWIGKIGLLSPSDFGYATSGGENVSREICLNTNLNDWRNTENSDCKNNNWLTYSKTGYETWTMHHLNTSLYFAFTIAENGYIKVGEPKCAGTSSAGVLDAQYVRPTIFLKESVEITSGDGSEENPFILYDSDWEKADYIKPEAKITLTRNGNDVIVDASKSTDNVGIKKYYYSLDNENWIESSENTHTFHEEPTIYQYGRAKNLLNDYVTQKISKVYVRVEDENGNTSTTYETIGPVIYDEEKIEIRYVGQNPDNYVLFNNELWRIVGSFFCEYESRVKIVRVGDIGAYSWNSKAGNDWYNSELYKILNPGYDEEAIGSSAYWYKSKSMCYTSYNEHSEVCDFTKIGLEYASRSMMQYGGTWQIGKSNSSNLTPRQFYVNSKNGSAYNKIGLINPEDYGYATDGGINTSREECLDTMLSEWNNESLSDCKNNNWLFDSNKNRWTMQTSPENQVFVISSDGSVKLESKTISGNEVGYTTAHSIQPAGYLESSVNITSGTGTQTDPFILQDSAGLMKDTIKPKAKMNVTKNDNLITIDASESTDDLEVTKYFYSKDGNNWIESTSSTYNFNENSNYNYGKATDVITNYYNGLINEVYLYVEDAAGNKSTVISKSFETVISNDNTKDENIRYVGAIANNYVDFNGEKWRIIGVMNNIDDGSGNKEQRIKIIRDESIGMYSWDTSLANDYEAGFGVNDWTNADLMKLLNSGYDSETVGGSLYWNRGTGTCYNDRRNATTTCDFSSNGLTNDAKNYIGPVLWHLGQTYSDYNNTPISFYNNQNNSTTSSKNPSTWVGSVALMYPSDYGFSTSGGGLTTREQCSNKAMEEWAYSLEDCGSNSWMIPNDKSTFSWTLQTTSDKFAHIINKRGSTSFSYEACSVSPFEVVADPGLIRPVVYLKNSVKIISGTGTKEDSF